MANLIEILIKASSGQATSELKKFDKQLDAVGASGKKASGGLGALSGGLGGLHGKLTGPGGVIGSWTELMSGLGLAERVLGAVKGAFDETIGVTIKYAEEVRDLSRALGTSTEESSRLLQIADDLKIETTQLQLAFRYALNKGIDPSIDGLKDLAAEYQKIEDPIQRAQFAMEKFGTRGGLAMQKVLEKTPDQLDAMAESAEKAGLILSEDAVKAAREYEIAMDDLADSVQGLKINIGTGLVPKVIDLTNLMNDLIAVEGEDWFMDISRASADFINSFIYGKKPIEETAEVLDSELKPALDGTEIATGEVSEATKKLIQGFDWAGRAAREYGIDIEKAWEETVRLERVQKGLSTLGLLIGGALGKETESFLEQEADLIERTDELKEKIGELGGMEYMTPEQVEDIEGARRRLGGVTAEIEALQDALKEGDVKKKHRDDARERIEDLKEEAGRLEDVIESLGSTPYLSTEQKKQLEEAREQMGELTAAIQENADEHEEATKRILLDLIQQRAAQMGLLEGPQGDKALKLLDDLALKWGLIDQETYDALTTIDKALTAIGENKGVTVASNMISEIDGAAFDAGEQVDELNRKAQVLMATIDDVVGEYEIHFTITQSGDIPTLKPGQNQRELLADIEEIETRHTGGPVTAGQMYDVIPGEFFVPDRDGYVTPPRQIGGMQPDTPTTATAAAATADSGAINNYNYHIYNPAAMAMALDEQRRASSRNLNASAGRL